MERVRIDKWLWAARFFKTRSAATDAVAGGHVQVGGERVKPAKEIQVGDRLEIRRGEVRWTVVVTGLADRRGSASLAATLYDETKESIANRERERAERRVARPLGADLGARPTKQDRRRLEALRRGQRRRPELEVGRETLSIARPISKRLLRNDEVEVLVLPLAVVLLRDLNAGPPGEPAISDDRRDAVNHGRDGRRNRDVG